MAKLMISIQTFVDKVSNSSGIAIEGSIIKCMFLLFSEKLGNVLNYILTLNCTCKLNNITFYIHLQTEAMNIKIYTFALSFKKPSRFQYRP